MRRALVWVAALVLVVGGLALAEVLSGTSSRAAGTAAPALPARVLHGHRITVAGLRGKPAIVHFWASWCGPCTQEAPELARLGARLGGRATLHAVDTADHGYKVLKKSRASDEDVFVEMARVARDWVAKLVIRKPG